MAAETALQIRGAGSPGADRSCRSSPRPAMKPSRPPSSSRRTCFSTSSARALRARTYVFTDPDGAELCLRPDLTAADVPPASVRVMPTRRRQARYCYNGPAFRFQPQGADAAHPREFRQAGIERFGEPERENAEAATIALIVKAIEAAGLKSWSLRIGDLACSAPCCAAANVPERWQKRLDRGLLAARSVQGRVEAPDDVRRLNWRPSCPRRFWRRWCRATARRAKQRSRRISTPTASNSSARARSVR